MNFPQEHWTRIYSTNPLERLNREIKQRTNAVGARPDDGLVLRMVGAVLMQTWDEWQVGRRHICLDSMRKFAEPDPLLMTEPAPLRLGRVR